MFDLIFPVDSDLFLPVEVADIGDFSEAGLAWEVGEEIQLMDLDCDQGLHFDTVNLGLATLQTHDSEIVRQDVVSGFFLWVEVGLLLLSSSFGEGLVDAPGPDDLDTEEGNLGFSLIDPLSQVQSSAITLPLDEFDIFGALAALLSDGLHHRFLEGSEPKLDLTLAFHCFD